MDDTEDQDIATKKPDDALPDYMPEWMKNTSPMTIAQAMPGQLPMLAADLAAGGFGAPKANLQHLNHVYDPVQTLRFGVPPEKPKTPVTPVTPVTPTTKPGDGTGAGKGKPSVSSYRWQDGKLVAVQDRYPQGRNSR